MIEILYGLGKIVNVSLVSRKIAFKIISGIKIFVNVNAKLKSVKKDGFGTIKIANALVKRENALQGLNGIMIYVFVRLVKFYSVNLEKKNGIEKDVNVHV